MIPFPLFGVAAIMPQRAVPWISVVFSEALAREIDSLNLLRVQVFMVDVHPCVQKRDMNSLSRAGSLDIDEPLGRLAPVLTGNKGIFFYSEGPIGVTGLVILDYFS